MEFKNILFVIIAIVVWVYSSYRKLQKEAVKRSREIIKQAELQKAETVLQTTEQKKKVRRPADFITVEKRVDETKQAEDFWSSRLAIVNPENKIVDVDKKNQSKNDSLIINSEASSLINDIHSENIDWKRAIILSDILRPVYF